MPRGRPVFFLSASTEMAWVDILIPRLWSLWSSTTRPAIIAGQIMDENSPKNKTRKTPGPTFFLVALFVYLCVVQGLSLWSLGPNHTVPASSESALLPHATMASFYQFLAWMGQSSIAHYGTAMALLYGCMICLFHLTRRLAKGPVWLGSLAAAVFMAHPAKTEVFFSAMGLYYLASALLALLSLLTYLRFAETQAPTRYLVALCCFAVASFPFPINATLFGVLVMLEFYPGTAETRRWVRLVPFLVVTIIANGLHLESLYAHMPDFAENFRPLLLLIYPIGLLPETVAKLHAAAPLAWCWCIGVIFVLVISMVVVRNGAYRVCVLALLSFRFYPGTESIDLVSMSGGGQLLVPIALGCIAFAGFCKWLMQFEDWGRPTVALTTMLCIVLFVLQFQANRAWPEAALRRERPVSTSSATEAFPHG